MRPETRRWLEHGEEDLGHAIYLSQGGRHAPAAFFAQQAAEKVLKAAIIEKSGRFPRVHDLAVLARELKPTEDVLAACELLSPAYTGARYPDVTLELTDEETAEIISAAKEVIAWIRTIVS